MNAIMKANLVYVASLAVTFVCGVICWQVLQASPQAQSPSVIPQFGEGKFDLCGCGRFNIACNGAPDHIASGRGPTTRNGATTDSEPAAIDSLGAELEGQLRNSVDRDGCPIMEIYTGTKWVDIDITKDGMVRKDATTGHEAIYSNGKWYWGYPATDSHQDGEPNSAEILRARDPNGFWLGDIYLAHDFEIVSDEEALRRKVAPLIREEIQKMADDGSLILLDPDGMLTADLVAFWEAPESESEFTISVSDVEWRIRKGTRIYLEKEIK